MTDEDREATRDYYDQLGDAEATRLTADVAGRVSFEVHRRFLARSVRPGARVLEVGAGSGRFTTELAALGASVVVTDFSPVQLGLNRPYVGSADAEAAVERRELLDVCDVRWSRASPSSRFVRPVLRKANERASNSLRSRAAAASAPAVERCGGSS